MNREELEAYILNHYSTEPDYPWADTSRAAVFRHAGNRKWFALVMEVPRDKLGLAGTEKLDIVNFKCDPILISSLRGETGIFPAYHTNSCRLFSQKASLLQIRVAEQRQDFYRRGVVSATDVYCKK